jgi:hypothetical protein
MVLSLAEKTKKTEKERNEENQCISKVESVGRY